MVNRLLLMHRPRLVPGAVAYWDCTQLSPDGQTVYDLSGNGYHATLGSDPLGVDTNDPAPYLINGVPAGLAFGADDYVDMGTAPGLNLANQDHTLIAVVTPILAGISTTEIVIGKPNLAAQGWGIIVRDQMFIFEHRGTTIASVMADATYAPGVPYMVAGVRSGATTSLYIGATKQATTGTVTTEPNVAVQSFTIGKRYGGASFWATSTVHAAMLYPGALSLPQIAQNHAALKGMLAPRGVTLA